MSVECLMQLGRDGKMHDEEGPERRRKPDVVVPRAAFPAQLCVVVLNHVMIKTLPTITAAAIAAIDVIDGGTVRYCEG
jgi:hypothetical protein